jgi:hypothetical protein
MHEPKMAVLIEYEGERMCQADWAAKLGLRETTFKSRVKARGPFEAIRLSLLMGPKSNFRKIALRTTQAAIRRAL